MNGRSHAGVPSDLANESKFQNLTRVGFAARGILYITIAVLAIRTGQSEDMKGAMKALAEGVGGWLLGLMAAGMAAYALWRFADAAFGIEHPERDEKAYLKRAVAFVIGCIYVGLAYTAVRLLTSDTSASSDQDSPLPSGTIFAAIGAIVMLVAGVSQLVIAAKCSFLKHLSAGGQEDWVEWLGRAGYTARGLVFLAVAYLLARSALRGGSSSVGGTEQGLSVFDGTLWLAIAIGLGLFGVFSIVEARYRRIRRPPVEQAGERIREKVGG